MFNKCVVLEHYMCKLFDIKYHHDTPNSLLWQYIFYIKLQAKNIDEKEYTWHHHDNILQTRQVDVSM